MAHGGMIGIPTERREGRKKVTGRTRYAVDVAWNDMIWGKTLRSSIPYGRIKKIDASGALKLRGVRAVLTGRDAQGFRIGRRIYDMPVLAEDVVRFVGEKVAAVAADSEEIASAALDLIDVEYEEMEPLLDAREAVKPSAPLLHPGVAGYRGLVHRMESPSNVVVHLVWKKGDVDEGFAHSDLIVENTFTTAPVHQAYIEPHSCVVQANSAGAKILACSKVPFALRDQVATALGLRREAVVVHPCDIGGCFGGKGDFMDVPLGYLLSRRSGRPVKMVMDYAEEFIAGNPRHASVVRVRTGVSRDGRLVAQKMEFLFDSGAYAAFKPIGYLHGPQKAAGPCRLPYAFIEEKIVYTNKVPCGHMRAPGDPQACFANESQMDAVARRLGMDPVAFRKLNLMCDNDASPTGRIITHIKAREAIDAVMKVSAHRRRKAKKVGRGMAIFHWLPMGGLCHVHVTVDGRGAVTINCAMLDQGSGAYTAMRQVAAEELKVPVERVKISTRSTDIAESDSGVGASRSTRIYGNATRQASAHLLRSLLEDASKILRVPTCRIAVTGDGSFRGRGRILTYEDTVGRTAALASFGYYNDATIGPEASVCAQVAEVEVDMETGQVTLREFTTAHATGKVINPLLHQGQIDGGVIMGIGYALMEELRFDGGKVVTTNFGENKIPNIRDIPVLKTVVLEEPVGSGPYGAMSIGEIPVVPVAPAIANAIYDAVGVRIRDLPITAEKVLSALKEKRGSS